MHAPECDGKCMEEALKQQGFYVGDPPCTVKSGSSTVALPVARLVKPAEEQWPKDPNPPEGICDSKAPFLRPEVEIFARAMEIRLRQKDDERCGNSWQSGADVRELLDYLQKKVGELSYALATSGSDGKTLIEIGTNVLGKAADVANLAMIVADWFGATGNIEHLEAQLESPPTKSGT